MKTLNLTLMATLALVLASVAAPAALAQTRPQGDRVEQIFARFDANKDGKLVANELPAPIWSRLSAADLDKDGAVTMEEVRKYRSGQ